MSKEKRSRRRVAGNSGGGRVENQRSGKMTYELVMRKLRSHYQREGSRLVKMQQYVSLQQGLGEDHWEYLKCCESLSRGLGCFVASEDDTSLQDQLIRARIYLNLAYG